MHPALWTSATGLDAQSYNLKIISNNIANVGTAAYKRSRPIFRDLFYQSVKEPGAITQDDIEHTTGVMLGSGVKITGNQKIYEQGSILRTNNQFDLAIKGNGFFKVDLPDDTHAYTRDGTFSINATGSIVTTEGYPLNPQVSGIDATAESVEISSDGKVYTYVSGVKSLAGQIMLSSFPNPSGLKPIGDNLVIPSDASGYALETYPGQSGLGILEQGALEESNVNIVEELVRMIEAQRAYEMNAKAVESVDSMLVYLSQHVG